MDLHERRKHERMSVITKALVDVGGERINATSIDVSHAGMALWTKYKAPEGTVRVALELDGTPVAVRGQVVRMRRGTGGAVWGIEFESLSEAARSKLEAWIGAEEDAA